MSLTFEQFSEVNAARCDAWHHGWRDGVGWSGADWSNAMAGEAGEACNIVKKLRRAEVGLANIADLKPDQLVGDLADELADVVAYLDLLATFYSIDLGRAVAEKFNRISEREGRPERLPAPSSGEEKP